MRTLRRETAPMPQSGCWPLAPRIVVRADDLAGNCDQAQPNAMMLSRHHIRDRNRGMSRQTHEVQGAHSNRSRDAPGSAPRPGIRTRALLEDSNQSARPDRPRKAFPPSQASSPYRFRNSSRSCQTSCRTAQGLRRSPSKTASIITAPVSYPRPSRTRPLAPRVECESDPV